MTQPKVYGYIAMAIYSGRLGKIVHKSPDCLKIRWSYYVRVSRKDVSQKGLKKCKACWKE